MKPKIVLYALILFIFALSACQSPSSNETITEPALVESIEILILESFPVQVHVRVKGILGDSCTTLGQITQTRQNNTFMITVMATRPADAICAAIIAEFEKVIVLDVYGLPAGTYTVDVNGVRDTFTLPVDNAMPSSFMSGEVFFFRY